MTITITEKMINYFMSNYGVDVSNVRIIDTDLDNCERGRYRTNTPNCIYISSKNINIMAGYNKPIVDVLTTTAIVHEITHYMQYTHGIYATIKTSMPYVTLSNTYRHREYADRQVEYDAICSEIKYLHYANRHNIHKVINIIKEYAVRVLATATVPVLTTYCIDNNEEDWYKDILNHVIERKRHINNL